MSRSKNDASPKGLRQFLNAEQQGDWLEGKAKLPDAAERSESLEQRFKYVARFEKLLRRPQAQEVLEILKLYGASCLPIPRKTERYYWSVSCLPSTSDKPLARVNASWMELFTLLPDGEGLRARFILHLSDFTADGSPEPDHLDQASLEQCVARPEDVSHSFWSGPDIFIAKVRGSASIRKFLANPRALRAIRTFNLTHMNRGRNAYQASHCYSLADCMLEV
jgi:preprotein translocase subunit Sss1